MWSKGSRPTYAITTRGILRPSRDHPLLRWESFDGFEVKTDNPPLLVLFRKQRKCREITLRAEAELRGLVVGAVAAHLPQRPLPPDCTVLPARGFFRRILRRALLRCGSGKFFDK